MLGMSDKSPTQSPQESTPGRGPPKPAEQPSEKPAAKGKVEEIGGPKGPEPTRYGDWEVNGRVSDF